MLDKCTALIVAGQRSGMTELAAFARYAGFGATISAADEQPQMGSVGPITFFLLHSHMPADEMRAVSKALRRSSDPNLRFAPVIVVGENMTQEQARRFASDGFDDIISLPIDRHRLVARLEEQLSRTNYYYETDTYLGPDRRRDRPREVNGQKSYTLLRIWRDPVHGTTSQTTRIAGKAQFAPVLPQWLRG